MTDSEYIIAGEAIPDTTLTCRSYQNAMIQTYLTFAQVVVSFPAGSTAAFTDVSEPHGVFYLIVSSLDRYISIHSCLVICLVFLRACPKSLFMVDSGTYLD